MFNVIGGCIKSDRPMKAEIYSSTDDAPIAHRGSNAEDSESVLGVTTEEAQTLTVVSSPFTDKATEKGKMSMDASSTTLHGHYAVPAAKESSFSVTTTSTMVPHTHRHFLSYSKDHDIIPIRLLARHSVLGAIRIHIRLWRISSRLNRSDEIPDQFFQDLIELQRQNIYTSFVTSKAWNLLVRQIDPSKIKIIAENLLLFPENVVIDVLKKLARLDDMVTPWSTFTHYQPRFCLVFKQLLEDNRGRVMVHATLSMGTMAALLTERHTCEPTDVYLPLYRFFDALLTSTLPAIPQVFVTIGRCELPPPAECFVQYLLTTRSPKTMLTNLRKLVDVIMSFVQAFADTIPFENYLSTLYGTYPALRTTHCDPHGVTLHPILPFFQLVFRIAFHLPQAADMFIHAGILGVIRKLWCQGFPDLRAEPLSETQVLINWPETHRRNCMVITSLFVLGSLARYHPSVRDFADHLLRRTKMSDGHVLKLHWDAAMIEARVWSMRLTEFFPQGRVAKEVHPANSLPFFLMETCVANCTLLEDYRGSDSGCQLWKTITGIIAIEDTTNQGATEIKDAAVRILLSCASTSEDHWHPASHTIISMPYIRAFRAFQYIIHKFLRASDANISGDCFELPSDTISFLRRLQANAKARGSEVTNPIDRFIMMSRRITTDCPRHALTLLDAGLADLLEAVVNGYYDKFFRLKEDDVASTQGGDSDSLLSRSSVDSPVTISDQFIVRRLPMDVRTKVCTAMVRELRDASTKARSQSQVSLCSPTSLHTRTHRPLPKIPNVTVNIEVKH